MLDVDDKTVRKAWAVYHTETRNLIGHKYEEMEPWAWAKLQSALGNLKPKRKTAVA